jgi:hypothetical protein
VTAKLIRLPASLKAREFEFKHQSPVIEEIIGGQHVLMNEHGLSGVGEHESGPKDGKLSVQQKSASAQLHGCAREGKTKDSNRSKIKTKHP